MHCEIISEVLRNSEEHFNLTGPASLGKVDIQHNPYSDTIRLELFIGSVENVVYIKQVTTAKEEGDPINANVATEFNILRGLYGYYSGQSHLAVVRPIALLPKYNAIVTEEAPGPCLQTLLGRGARIYSSQRDCEVLGRYCFLAGAWLRLFQAFTRKGAGPFRIEDLVKYCDLRLRDLCCYPRSGVDERLRAAVLAYLNDMGQRIDETRNIIAGRHNDYAPHNMIAQNRTLCVLDFGFFDYDSTVYDACRFWYRLETMKVHPLFDSRCLSALQAQFLKAYGDHVNTESAAFKLAKCRFVVVGMAALVDQRSPTAVGNLVKWRLYRKYLAWLKSECTRS